MTPPNLALDLRLILSAVFLSAGVLKLIRGKGEEEDLLFAVGFGNGRAVRTSIRALPFAEIALGLWLLGAWYAWLALGLSVSLLMAFLAVLFLAYRAGFQGGCSCFGARSGRPIGPSDLVFDSMLIVVALLAIAVGYRQGFPPQPAWSMAGEDTIAIVLIALYFGAVHLLLREVESVARAIAANSDG